MAPSCIDVRGCQIFQALMISLMIVVPDEGGNVRFEITGQEVVF